MKPIHLSVVAVQCCTKISYTKTIEITFWIIIPFSFCYAGECFISFQQQLRPYPGCPCLDYPKPRLSERGVCLQNMVFSLKSQTLQQSRVHVFVCHMYVFNVSTPWYVIVYSVKCNGLQTQPSYIFLCYNSMYIARKVSFGLSEQFRLSEQLIKPLCPKVFG